MLSVPEIGNVRGFESSRFASAIWRSLLNDCGATVIVLTEHGRIEFINNLGVESFQIAADAAIGLSLGELVGEDVAAERMELVGRAISTGRTVVARIRYGTNHRTTTIRPLEKNERGEQLVLLVSRFTKIAHFVEPEAELIDQQTQSPPILAGLSGREVEVLTLIAEGLSSAQIAARLKRSVKTVEAHRMQLGRKLRARNRSDLTRIAVAAGLVGSNWSEGEAPTRSETSIWTLPGGDAQSRPRNSM